MKRIKTTAANAVKNGLVKEGQKIWLELEVSDIDIEHTNNPFKVSLTESLYFYIYNDTNIFIPKPEPKPIDFGNAGLVLKLRNTIVCTTGYEAGGDAFTAYVLESDISNKGFSSNDYDKRMNWQDITENYYLNNPK